MGFISVSKLVKEKSSNNRGNGMAITLKTKKRLAMSITVGKEKTPAKCFVLSFRLSEPLMRDARWITGDFVEFLFDPENCLGLLKRTTDKKAGYTLTPSNSSCKEAYSESKGKSVTAQVRVPIGDLPFFVKKAIKMTECENINLEEEGIMFAIMPQFLNKSEKNATLSFL